MLRVKLVSPMPPPAGGIARWTSMITEYGARQEEVQISVINTALRWRTVEQNSAAARIIGGIPQMTGCVASLLVALLRHQVDVVHINASGQFSVFRDLALATISRTFRIPFVYHIRFGRIPEVLSVAGWERQILSFVVHKASTIIALDERTEAALHDRFPDSEIVRIPNCVELSSGGNLGDSHARKRPYALFVGWVIPSKGISELVSAWKRVSPEGWKLVVAGTYAESYLEILGLEPGMNGNIEILGEVSHQEVMRLVADSEMFVLPSYTEGFPNSVLEAMSYSKAVISTDVGAVKEMLSGESGIVVPPRDQRALEIALLSLATDPELRSSIGIRARKKVEDHYSLPGAFRRYCDIWRSSAKSLRPKHDCV